jgi:hypothetical protein
VANKATTYSDFYKTNGADPKDPPDPQTPNSIGARNQDSATPEDAAAKLRKKALQRRLKKMRASNGPANSSGG